MSLKRRSDAQTHFRRLTPTELRHSSIAATWYVEQRRCTGRRPPRCSSCFFQTVFKIVYKNCSSNIGVSCCVQIQLEGTSVGNLFLIKKEKNAGRPFPFQNTFSFFRQPCFCLNPGMPATTVPSATVPPAMAAAVLRPGATTSTDINDLHASLGHAHEGNLRETAKHMGIRLTGTLVPCSKCTAVKGIYRSVSRSTARRATRPLELLYGYLSGAMPTSTGGSV